MYHSKILLYGNFDIFLWLLFLIELRLCLAALFWGVYVIFTEVLKSSLTPCPERTYSIEGIFLLASHL